MKRIPSPVQLTVYYSLDDVLFHLIKDMDTQEKFMERLLNFKWVHETQWNHHSYVAFDIQAKTWDSLHVEIQKRHQQLQTIINRCKKISDEKENRKRKKE